MRFSIVDCSEVRNLIDFRIDSEYWHPNFINNSKKVETGKKIRDFVSRNILNIKSNPINRDFKYLEISKIDLNNCQYEILTIKQGKEPDRAHYILNKGDIVVSKVRPNRNAVALIEDNGIVGSSGLAILRAKNIEKEYLLVFCKTDYFIKCLIRVNKSTMYPEVLSRDIFEIPMFLPSIKFRTVIVKKVRQVFLKYRNSKKLYKQAQTILLSEIDLANWQSNHQLTFVKNLSDIEQAGRIDAEYYQLKYADTVHAIKNYSGGWDTLDNLVCIKKCIEVGSTEYLDKGIPFVRVSNISPFELSEEKYISSSLYNALTPQEEQCDVPLKKSKQKDGMLSFEKSSNHQPKRGEILFSKDGTPGIAYYLKDKPQNMLLSSGILRLKNKTNKVNEEYLTLVLNSKLTQEQVNRDMGGSIILHCRLDQIKKIVVPILPNQKQLKLQKTIAKSFKLRKQSKCLLECVKQAVEMAIEQDEQTAIKWLKNKTKKMQITGTKPKQARSDGFADSLARMDEKTKKRLRDLVGFLNDLGDDVRETQCKRYKAFWRIKKFASVKVLKGKLKIIVKSNPVEVIEGFARDVSKIGRFGTGNLEITIASDTDLARAKPLIQKSYEAS